MPFENANIRLKSAVYIPSLGYNLVSTGRLADNGVESHFRRHDVRFIPESVDVIIGRGTRDSKTGMYMLAEPHSGVASNCALVAQDGDKTEL